MKKAGIIILIFIIVGTVFANAQEFVPEEPVTTGNYGLYAGGLASTNGFGMNLGYVISPKITLKGGVETLSFNKGFNFDENDISYSANLNFKTGSIFMVADYLFTPHLYLSGGAGLNKFHPKINGEAVSDMQYGDISIPASDVGDFRFSVEPSLKIAPYLAAGYRKFIGAQKRVVYNFETGLYYMGAPKVNIEATGLLSPTADPAHGQKAYLEKQFDAYKIYPVIKFNLAVKLF